METGVCRQHYSMNYVWKMSFHHGNRPHCQLSNWRLSKWTAEELLQKKKRTKMHTRKKASILYILNVFLSIWTYRFWRVTSTWVEPCIPDLIYYCNINDKGQNQHGLNEDVVQWEGCKSDKSRERNLGLGIGFSFHFSIVIVVFFSKWGTLWRENIILWILMFERSTTIKLCKCKF